MGSAQAGHKPDTAGGPDPAWGHHGRAPSGHMEGNKGQPGSNLAPAGVRGMERCLPAPVWTPGGRGLDPAPWGLWGKGHGPGPTCYVGLVFGEVGSGGGWPYVLLALPHQHIFPSVRSPASWVPMAPWAPFGW